MIVYKVRGCGQIEKNLKRMSKKSQTSPGTLLHVGEEGEEDVVVRMIQYNQAVYSNKEIRNVQDINIEDKTSVNWIDIVGLKDIKIIQDIGEKFNLHKLLLEDVLNTTHQPKMEAYGDCLFTLVKILKYHEETNNTTIEQISFVIFENTLITFKEFADDVFSNVMERIETGTNIRKNEADYLFYGLLDAIVDGYFLELEKIDDKIDLLEEELMINPQKRLLQEIYELKREMIYIRNSIWPLRNIISNLTTNEFQLINEKTIYYLRDIHDHIIQIIDIMETYRDILSGMLDTYLSSIGHKTNEVMKVLTIFSTIFIPLTFLAGVYGMNFHNLPELKWKYGYFIFWIISIMIFIGMIRYFRKKRWI